MPHCVAFTTSVPKQVAVVAIHVPEPWNEVQNAQPAVTQLLHPVNCVQFVPGGGAEGHVFTTVPGHVPFAKQKLP